MSSPGLKSKRSKTFLLIGLIILFGGFAINTTFMLLGIAGYLRELSRLTTIIGLVVTLIGLVQLVIQLFIRKDSKN